MPFYKRTIINKDGIVVREVCSKKRRKSKRRKIESFDVMKPKNPKKHIHKNKLYPTNGLPISSGFETNRKRH